MICFKYLPTAFRSMRKVMFSLCLSVHRRYLYCPATPSPALYLPAPPCSPAQYPPRPPAMYLRHPLPPNHPPSILYPPPPDCLAEEGMLRRGRYASCGYVGGLLFFNCFVRPLCVSVYYVHTFFFIFGHSRDPKSCYVDNLIVPETFMFLIYFI